MSAKLTDYPWKSIVVTLHMNLKLIFPGKFFITNITRLSMCLIQVFLSLNAFPHRWHWKGSVFLLTPGSWASFLSWPCIVRSRLNDVYFLLNVLVHKLHVNTSLFDVCLSFVCLARLNLFGNNSLQISQLNVREGIKKNYYYFHEIFPSKLF